MPSMVVVGLQWGDEGKGKITDYLASGADMVVRFQGGKSCRSGGNCRVADRLWSRLPALLIGVRLRAFHSWDPGDL